MPCALLASALLLTGCWPVPRHEVIPDQGIPHQLAADADVVVWVRLPDGSIATTPDGTFVTAKVHAPKGWWIASDRLVEPTTTPTK